VGLSGTTGSSAGSSLPGNPLGGVTSLLGGLLGAHNK
jgi:hypothetical protein